MSHLPSAHRSTDLPLVPALYLAALSIGAAVHSNPGLLRPVLGWVHTLTSILVA